MISQRPEPIPLYTLQQILVPANEPPGRRWFTTSPSVDDLDCAIPTPSLQIDEAAVQRQVELLRVYGSIVIVRDNVAIAPWSALATNKEVAGKDPTALPLYIDIPAYMPSKETPWVVNSPPTELIGVGTRVELALVGFAVVQRLLNSATTRKLCVLLLRTENGHSPVYLALPRAWTRTQPTESSQQERRKQPQKKRSLWQLLGTRGSDRLKGVA